MPFFECRDAACRMAALLEPGAVGDEAMPLVATSGGKESEATRPVVRGERRPRSRPGGVYRRSCVVLVCEERKAAWGQEKGAEVSRARQSARLSNTDVDLGDALTTDDAMLPATGEARLPTRRKAEEC